MGHVTSTNEPLDTFHLMECTLEVFLTLILALNRTSTVVRIEPIATDSMEKYANHCCYY